MGSENRPSHNFDIDGLQRRLDAQATTPERREELQSVYDRIEDLRRKARENPSANVTGDYASILSAIDSLGNPVGLPPSFGKPERKGNVPFWQTEGNQ